MSCAESSVFKLAPCSVRCPVATDEGFLDLTGLCADDIVGAQDDEDAPSSTTGAAAAAIAPAAEAPSPVIAPAANQSCGGKGKERIRSEADACAAGQV